jgi:hypothetical protein
MHAIPVTNPVAMTGRLIPGWRHQRIQARKSGKNPKLAKMGLHVEDDYFS